MARLFEVGEIFASFGYFYEELLKLIYTNVMRELSNGPRNMCRTKALNGNVKYYEVCHCCVHAGKNYRVQDERIQKTSYKRHTKKLVRFMVM